MTDPEYRPFDRLLVLGGGGLVGTQVCKRAAREFRPRSIVLATLFQEEVRERVESLARDYPDIEWQGYYGNIFLRGRPTPFEEAVPASSPSDQKSDSRTRRDLFSDIFFDFETAYRESMLTRLIRETRPTAIVDCVNTATGISYQDVFMASDIVSRGLEELRQSASDANGDTLLVQRKTFDAFGEDVEKLLVSIAIPELILHIRLLYRAMVETKVRAYVKVGTTGTGGMGLNIPYTHGEDRPSPTLMTKTAIGFAQTGLLFLMARTADAPIVKEVKPAAMIGYRDIDYMLVRGPQFQKDPKKGRPVLTKNSPYVLYEPQEQALEGTFDTTPRLDEFEARRDETGEIEHLKLPVVNTGENGIFTKGEFEAITYVDQMEFMTPEEIAEAVVLELRGSNTGHDVISAIDSSVMNPTYKAGMIRHVALRELESLERERETPSIALGQLGPPQLAKYLYEAHLFRVLYRTLENVLGTADRAAPTDEEISESFLEYLRTSPLRNVVTSIGIPILLPDGRRIWRGPTVKIPAYNPKRTQIALDSTLIDLYATKGWVDLRPSQVKWWRKRFSEMLHSVETLDSKRSSERLTRRAYVEEKIRIGQVVAWIFNNTLEPPGHRIK